MILVVCTQLKSQAKSDFLGVQAAIHRASYRFMLDNNIVFIIHSCT